MGGWPTKTNNEHYQHPLKTKKTKLKPTLLGIPY
jgi:hypothetical protein